MTNMNSKEFSELSSDDQLLYIKNHPEVTRQFSAHYVLIDSYNNLKPVFDTCLGLVEDLLDNPSPNDAQLAEMMYGHLCELNKGYKVIMINFWEC